MNKKKKINRIKHVKKKLGVITKKIIKNKHLIVVIFFILLSLLFAFIQNQEEQNKKRLRAREDKILQMIDDEKIKEKKLLDCEDHALKEYEVKNENMQNDFDFEIANFENTLQYKDAKEKIDEAQNKHDDLVSYTSPGGDGYENLEALCDFSNRVPGENPVNTFNICNSTKKEFRYTLDTSELKLNNLKNDLLVLQKNYYSYIEEMFEEEFLELKIDFEHSFNKCKELK